MRIHVKSLSGCGNWVTIGRANRGTAPFRAARAVYPLGVTTGHDAVKDVRYFPKSGQRPHGIYEYTP